MSFTLSRVFKTKARRPQMKRKRAKREKGLLSKSKYWKKKDLKSKKQHNKNLEILTGSFLNLKCLESK